MKKLTHKNLVALANEERSAAKMYKKMGFWRFSRDEAKHAFILGKMAKRLKK